MRLLAFLAILLTYACSHDRKPASLNGHPLAQDSIALGNVKANAIKVTDQQDVCFEISLFMKGVPQHEAETSNWTVAWVDKNDTYHLMTMHQRDPASEPKGGTHTTAYGAWEEWTNSFKTCASKVKLSDVKSVVLTPKDLTYKETKSLNLQWQ